MGGELLDELIETFDVRCVSSVEFKDPGDWKTVSEGVHDGAVSWAASVPFDKENWKLEVNQICCRPLGIRGLLIGP